jgi:hypothetical protein
VGLIEIPGGMYEYAHDGPPGCWIVTESGAGGDPDTARLLLRVLDGAHTAEDEW